MGFAGGAVGFQRFYIDGAFPDLIDDKVVERLGERAFGRVASLPDGTQLGWVGPGHLFETELRAERIAFGRFAHFALRVDVAKTPPNVLKGYIQIEEETARQATGRDFLSRGERKAAREAALARAEQELRGGAFRRMSAYPVLIDLEGRTVYFASPSISIGDHLLKLFSDTFGVGLQPADPGRVALRLTTASGRQRALEHLEPTPFVPPPVEGREATIESPPHVELGFLGPELLTWLWRRTEAERGPLRLQGGDALVVAFEKSLKLKCAYALTGTDTIASEAPLLLPEARAALRIGKLPVRAGLVLGSPLGEFHLTLDAERLTVSGLTLPPPEQPEEDPRAALEQRFELIVDAADLLDALFELFLHERLDRAWSGAARQIGAWAQGREEPGELLAVAGA